MILTKWNPKDIKGSLKTLCENMEKEWAVPHEGVNHRKLEPMEYTGGERVLLMFLEDNARTEGGTMFKPEERGKWFVPPEAGKWRFEPTKELCNLSLDEVLDLLDEKGICQKFAQDHDKVIEARAMTRYLMTDWKKVERRVQEIGDAKIDRGITPELFIHGKGIRKIKDTPLEDKRLVIYEKDDGRTKTRVQALLPFGEEVVFLKSSFEVWKRIIAFGNAEKTMEPIIRHKTLADITGRGKVEEVMRLLAMPREQEDRAGKTWEIGHLLDYAKRFGTDPGDKNSFWITRPNPEYATYLQAHIDGTEPLPKYDKYALGTSGGRQAAFVNLLLRYDRPKRIKSNTYATKTLLRKLKLTETEIKTKSMTYLAGELDKAVEPTESKWTLVFDEDSLKELQARNRAFQKNSPLEIVCFNQLSALFTLSSRERTAGEQALQKADFLRVKAYFVKVGFEKLVGRRTLKAANHKKGFSKPEDLGEVGELLNRIRRNMEPKKDSSE